MHLVHIANPDLLAMLALKCITLGATDTDGIAINFSCSMLMRKNAN